MAELFLEIFLELIFRIAIYIPGCCIAAFLGRSPSEISEGDAVGLSIVFWVVIFIVGSMAWALFKFIT